MSDSVKNEKWDSETLRYEQMIYLKMFRFSRIVRRMLVIHQKWKVQDLVNMSEAPKVIQKVLENVRNHELAIWEYLKNH